MEQHVSIAQQDAVMMVVGMPVLSRLAPFVVRRAG
jgi:hypothetical protein